MNRRLGAVAIVLMALAASAGVLSFVFFPQPVPKDSATASTPATQDSSSSPSQSSAPTPSPAAQSESSAPKLTEQPQDTSTSTQNSATNRTAQKTVPAASSPRRSIADILEGVDLSKPGERERVVAEMRRIQESRKAEAERVAREKGWPIRVEAANGSIREIADLDESGNPVYFITHNINAAISTGANILQASPYSLNGLNLILGQWDGGSARSTHQEFGGRVTVKDGAGSIDHATHVAGTMIAAGVNASAKGMATSARIDSYDWNSDYTEMTAAGAALATDTNRILISNHSYGYSAGWVYVGNTKTDRVYEWYGNGTATNSADSDFGLYNTYARQSDSLAYSAPYYLMFRSAGNDRWDNPSNGQAVGLSPNATSVVNYDSAVHPAGDNLYRGGYETISYDATAKNVITIGSISDAVSGANRSVAAASLSGFSSTGPTDDGRIKPDVVANGDNLYSSLSGSDSSYGGNSGTSMSSPNAAGSAALVAQEYIRLFGRAMRSSTLKGLLIHTADDLGNPGPDYRFGWGLINVRAAADLVRDQYADPAKIRLTEGQVTTSSNQITHEFRWDKTNPIRVTLAWTDPAAASNNIADSRTARLVNNLNLRLIGPTGATNLPYVMPFVGTWSQASMASNAVTGTNNVDNVEQVYLTNPPAPGVYRAIVSYSGTLSTNNQFYSLLVSGSSSDPLSSLSPSKGYVGSRVFLKITGSPTWRDTPENYSSWTNSSGAVSGFGAWTLSSSGSAGFFVGSSANSNMNVGAAKGFGLYAASNSSATAARNFNTPMGVGDRFTLKFDNNWLQNGGQAGFALTDTNGAARFRFYFVGGETYYRVSDATTGKQTSIPYTDNGLSLTFSLTNTNTYLLDAGNGYSMTGTLAIGSAISRLSVEATGIGSDSNYDFFVGEMALSGPALSSTSQIRLARSGQAAINSSSGQFSNGELTAELNLAGAASGIWDVLAVNPDGSSVSFPGAFTVENALWSENFDTTVSGWSNSLTTGTGSWSLNTNRFDSPSRSYAAAAPASKMTVALVSPTISVPTNAANLQLKFRHWYDLQSGRDGGRLELSTNNGTNWFATDDINSGVIFALNGYNSTLGGNTSTGSDFRGKSAWSGTSGNFMETVLSMTNTAKFAGTQLRFRWTLASDTTIASTGWHLDNIALLGTLNVPAPTPATITLGNLTQAYDGSAKEVSVTTQPPGLTVALTYNGLSAPPSGVGSYTVDASVTTAGYTGSTSGTLTVTRGSQTILFGNLPVVSFGDPSFDAGASSTSGLPVSYTSSNPSVATVDLSGTVSILGAGTATITASQAGDDNYLAATSVSQTLTVDKAVASVTLSNLDQIYDGTPRVISVTTDPPGLTKSITYNGSSSAPTNAGTYPVVATVNEPNYEGSASGTLVVGQASQSIGFSTASTARVGEVRGLAATATPSSLPVSFSSSDPSIASISSSTVTFQTPGSVTLTASQSGSGNYLAASNVSVTVSVTGVQNPTTDQDGDGVPALVEYALGGSSNGNDLGLLPVPVLSSSNLSMAAVVRTNDTNLLIYPQATYDLVSPTNWTTSGFTTNISNQTNVPIGFQRREYQFNTGTNPRAFLKLTIEQK